MKHSLSCVALLIVGACSGEAKVNEVAAQEFVDPGVSSAQSRNFVTLNLPRKVTVDLPKNWIALTANSRTTVDAAAESLASRLNADLPSELPFAANLYDDRGKAIALFNVRYYPLMDIAQQDLIAVSDQEIAEIDGSMRAGMEQMASSAGFSIVSWEGTKRIKLNGKIVLLTEYRRGYAGQPISRVRLVRILDGIDSFTVTVSYQERLGPLLEPITSHIISTIRSR